MSIVTVRRNYQVIILQRPRKQVGVNVGDLLEARAEKGRITLTPKTLADREISEGLEDVKRGRTYGPYNSAAEAVQALHRMTRGAVPDPALFT